LTRATAILATIFFATSIALTLMAGWGKGRSKSVLDGVPGAPISQQAPTPGGSALDDIKNMQRGPAAPPAGQPPQAPRSQ
jgi:preprotein translocase subunit SecG